MCRIAVRRRLAERSLRVRPGIVIAAAIVPAAPRPTPLDPLRGPHLLAGPARSPGPLPASAGLTLLARRGDGTRAATSDLPPLSIHDVLSQ